jgi:hypothetical protein
MQLSVTSVGAVQNHSREPLAAIFGPCRMAQSLKRPRVMAPPQLGVPEYVRLLSRWRAAHTRGTLQDVLGPLLAKEQQPHTCGCFVIVHTLQCTHTNGRCVFVLWAVSGGGGLRLPVAHRRPALLPPSVWSAPAAS